MIGIPSDDRSPLSSTEPSPIEAARAGSSFEHRRCRLAALVLAALLAAPAGCGWQMALDQIDPFLRTSLRLDDWLEIHDGSLTLYSNAPVETAQQFVEELALLRAVLARVTNIRNPENPPPVRIFLFHSMTGFRYFQPAANVGGYFGVLPEGGSTIVTPAQVSGRALSADGRWVLRYAEVGHTFDGQAVLFHEYVHLILRNSRHLIYPAWYDEGMAELLSTVRRNGDTVEVGGVVNTTDPTGFSMVALLSLRDYSELSPDQQESFYFRSWALLHMLSAGHINGLPDRRFLVQRYLALINQGRSERQACREAFGIGPAGLGRELSDYLTANTFPYMKIPTDELPTEPPNEPRSVPEPEALLLLAELSAETSGIESEVARTLVRAAEQSNPHSPQALAWSAFALEAKNRSDQAQQTIQRADEAGGGPSADRIIARLLLRRAEAEEIPSHRTIQVLDARSRISRSMTAEPTSIASRVLFGSSYLLTDEDPERAIRVLEEVLEERHFDTNVHLMLAELYERAGKRTSAKKSVEVVLQWARDPAVLEEANAVSARLNASN